MFNITLNSVSENIMVVSFIGGGKGSSRPATSHKLYHIDCTEISS